MAAVPRSAAASASAFDFGRQAFRGDPRAACRELRVLSRMMRFGARRPEDLLTAMLGARERAGPAVEELLRFDPPLRA